jgi:hypothetical protein
MIAILLPALFQLIALDIHVPANPAFAVATTLKRLAL